MATVTPNFNWPVPTSTDLVKDGATAIEALGDSIDASLLDLKGGTTGQVLSKTTNTDMDFVWVTTDDANAIQNSIVDAKGDIIAATANDTPARLAVGANDLLLTAASGEATGLKYTGGWTSYTPAFSNFTLGNGTVTAKYCQIGKTIFYAGRILLGSTSSVTGQITIGLPKTSNSPTSLYGSYQILDAGAAYYIGTYSLAGGSLGLGMSQLSGLFTIFAATSATVPMTWTTNDEIVWFVTYEVA
jgi:hypothetical protein